VSPLAFVQWGEFIVLSPLAHPFASQSTTGLATHHAKHEANKPGEAKTKTQDRALKAMGVVKRIARIDQKAADLALVNWLISHYHPLLTTEEPEFRTFCKELNPEYTPPSVETIKDRIGRLNQACNVLVRSVRVFLSDCCAQISKYLENNCETASFSSDGWTSRAGVSFTSVLVHAISKDFKLVSFCLAVEEIDGGSFWTRCVLLIAYSRVTHRRCFTRAVPRRVQIVRHQRQSHTWRG